jgi:membrane protein
MDKLKILFALLKETFKEWQEDKVTRLAAALAYFTIFSLAPLLIVVIAIAGAVFGHEAATGQLVREIRGLVGTDGARVIEDMIQNAATPGSGGTLATIIGVVTLILGASGVFGQLQDALNTIWGVMPKPGLGIKETIKNRILSFALVLGIGFLLLVSLVLSAGLSAVDEFLNNQFPGGGLLLQILNFVISYAVITLMFATMYRFLPDVKIAWRDVWVGAAVTAALFTIGKFLIGLYLGNSSTASVYGAAGSLVVLLIWIFYSAQIMLFGAEFTQVYATRYGSHLEPADNAIPITMDARARQGIPLKEDVEASKDLNDAMRQSRSRQARPSS